MISELEIVAIVVTLAAAAWAVLRQRPGATGWALIAAMVGATIIGAAQKHDTLVTRAQGKAEVFERAPKLHRKDDGFASSQTCKACHPREYETWHDSYHRTMTQLATPQAVVGDFDDVTLQDQGRTYALRRDGDAFFVETPDFEWERAQVQSGKPIPEPSKIPRVERRIILTTGSHWMQTYWYAAEDGKEMINFPFVYLFDAQRWVPREHVFLRPPDAGPLRQRWNDNCLGCHTTFGVPGGSKEGWNTEVAELGIACEACHGPAAEHVAKHQNLLERYAARLDDFPDDTIVNPARLPSRRSAEVCGQCHSKSWINDVREWHVDGVAYRPGEELEKSKTVVLPRSRPDHPWLQKSLQMDPAFADQFFWSDGMVRVSGREYNGMVESKCFGGSQLDCTSCHQLHADDPVMHLPEDGDLDRPCRECHESIAADLTAHTRHEAGSSGSECVNCHMPYTSYGLLKALRSHLIDSPSVDASLQTGRPNACNGCHLDRSLAWAAEQLQQGWNVQTSGDAGDGVTAASVDWLLRGDAGQRALMAWAYGWQPAQAASDTDWMAPLLAPLLQDPYAAVRFIAGRTFRGLPGYEDFEFDYLADPAQLEQASRRAREQWKGPTEPRPSVLLGDGGEPNDAAVQERLQQRDDRPVDLKE